MTEQWQQSWFLIFTTILGGISVVAGLISGIYESYTAVFGTSLAHLPLSKKHEQRSTGILLGGGSMAVVGGILTLSCVNTEETLYIEGIIGMTLGTLVGSLCGYMELNITQKMKALLLYGRQAPSSQKKLVMFITLLGTISSFGIAWKIGLMTISESLWAGGIGGFFTGLLAVFLREALLEKHRDLWVKIGGMCLFFGSMSGGPSVELLGMTLLTRLLTFSLLTGSLFPLVVVGKKVVAKGIMRIMIPHLSLRKFYTIVCQQCLRYTRPRKSRYLDGQRYCEHCKKPVEFTAIQGKVVFTFGTFSLRNDGAIFDLTNAHFEFFTFPQRQFVFSNPAFHQANHLIDVSEVYIDIPTCHRRRLEQFITYVLNYPPTDNIRSISIFYRGNLHELGEHLRNVLQNTFTQIVQIPDNSILGIKRLHKNLTVTHIMCDNC